MEARLQSLFMASRKFGFKPDSDAPDMLSLYDFLAHFCSTPVIHRSPQIHCVVMNCVYSGLR